MVSGPVPALRNRYATVIFDRPGTGRQTDETIHGYHPRKHGRRLNTSDANGRTSPVGFSFTNRRGSAGADPRCGRWDGRDGFGGGLGSGVAPGPIRFGRSGERSDPRPTRRPHAQRARRGPPRSAGFAARFDGRGVPTRPARKRSPHPDDDSRPLPVRPTAATAPKAFRRYREPPSDQPSRNPPPACAAAENPKPRARWKVGVRTAHVGETLRFCRTGRRA